MKKNGKDDRSVWWYISFGAAYLFFYMVFTDRVSWMGPTFIIMVIAFWLRTIHEKENE